MTRERIKTDDPSNLCKYNVTNKMALFCKDNLVDDNFSRISEINIPAAVDFSAITVGEREDEVLQSLNSDSKYKFKEFHISGSPSFFLCTAKSPKRDLDWKYFASCKNLRTSSFG